MVDLLAYALKMIQDVNIPKEELEQWAFKSLPVKLMKVRAESVQHTHTHTPHTHAHKHAH